jgi:hypothetical protein
MRRLPHRRAPPAWLLITAAPTLHLRRGSAEQHASTAATTDTSRGGEDAALCVLVACSGTTVTDERGPPGRQPDGCHVRNDEGGDWGALALCVAVVETWHVRTVVAGKGLSPGRGACDGERTPSPVSERPTFMRSQNRLRSERGVASGMLALLPSLQLQAIPRHRQRRTLWISKQKSRAARGSSTQCCCCCCLPLRHWLPQ